MQLSQAIWGRTKLEARPYQGRITEKATDMFRGHYRNKANELTPASMSVMIESPTGSGKTPTGLVTAATMQRNPEAFGAKKINVVWMAMRKELLGQARNEIVKWDIPVEATVLSMFTNTLPDHLMHLEEGEKNLLILDECQHDATTTMSNIHSTLFPNGRADGWFLGLSATPFRTDRLKLCFESVVQDCGIHQLITDGYLSPFDHYSMPDFQPETVAAFYAAEWEKWGKSVAYFNTFEQCQRFKTTLAALGHRTEVVTGESDRDTQLQAYGDGEFNIVTNMMVLTEGWDCPDLKTAFVRDSGKGPTTQMAGRVFRKHELLPVKQVVQSMKTHHPMTKTAAPRMQYMWQDNSWRSLQINPHIEEISRDMVHRLAMIEIGMPDYLTDKGKADRIKSWPPKEAKPKKARKSRARQADSDE